MAESRPQSRFGSNYIVPAETMEKIDRALKFYATHGSWHYSDREMRAPPRACSEMDRRPQAHIDGGKFAGEVYAELVKLYPLEQSAASETQPSIAERVIESKDMPSPGSGAYMAECLSPRREVMLAKPGSSSAPSSVADTNGWLIEMVSNDMTFWWSGGDKQPWEHYGEPHWTRDAFKAVRFTREQDARAVIDGWPQWLWEKVKVIDHLFIGKALGSARGSTHLAERLEANWTHIGEFFASRNWPDTTLGRAASDLNADIPRIVEVIKAAASATLPQEPTHEMRMAGAKVFDRTKNPYVAVLPIWRAMVEAARMAEISSKIAPDDERLGG